MSDLKPCPFCGADAREEHSRAMGGFCDEQEVAICCDRDCPGFEGEYLPRGLSISNWNTRPIEDQLRAENAELKAELERVRGLLKCAECEVFEDIGICIPLEDSERICDECKADEQSITRARARLEGGG